MFQKSALLICFMTLGTLISTPSLAHSNQAQSNKYQSFQVAINAQVYVNDLLLQPAQIRWLEQKYKIQMQAGAYWYDSKSGLWGLKNGPAQGLILPHLKLGGHLNANASGGGGTGVFVNGRELHPYDVGQLQAMYGSVRKGRFWLDAKGNVGYIGAKAFVNLRALAQKNPSNNFYRNSYTGIGSGSSGGSGYVMGKDWSVSW